MTLKIVQTLPEDVWQRFLQKHPHSNIFQSPEMFQVFDRGKGYRPALWAAVSAGGEALALLLTVEVTLLPGPFRLFTTRSIAYGSVLYELSRQGEEALDILLRAYRRDGAGGALFTELRNLSDLSAVQPVLAAQDFVYEDHLNYLIDLQRAPEEILQGIGKRARKQIRRGLRRAEVRIETVTTPQQVDICYEILRQTYANAQVPLSDISLFQAAFEALHPKNMIRLILAKIGDAYVGASVELLFRDIVYGWYGGVDRAYSKYTPNELIIWDILKWGAENDYRVYDFGGAGKPDEAYGVRDFKAKFGGELVNYGRNICVHSPVLLRLSAWGYKIYRRLA